MRIVPIKAKFEFKNESILSSVEHEQDYETRRVKVILLFSRGNKKLDKYIVNLISILHIIDSFLSCLFFGAITRSKWRLGRN